MKPIHVLFWLTLWRCTDALENGCHRLPVVENADVLESSLKTNYADGDLIHFTCKVGYVYHWKITYKCNDRRWTINRQPKCSPKQCEIPEDIVNGEYNFVNGTDFVFGAVIEYTCNEGYMLVGRSNTRLCLSEGWSDSAPSCKAITCDPEIPNAIILSGIKKYTLGERLDYECKQFHIPKGRQETFCRESGWEKKPDCKVVKCRPIQATGNLIARGNTESPQYGDIIQFECRTVYLKMNGGKQIHCTDTGEWSASIPRCEVVKCRPVQATGGLIACGNTKSPQHGDIIQFECRNDYMKIKGEKQIHCTDAGEWSASIPQCEDINADRKAVIRDAKMSEVMQRDAIDCATKAMEKFSGWLDIARYIREEFDKKYKPRWHCIVARSFASYVRYDEQHYISFFLGKFNIVLFKSG